MWQAQATGTRQRVTVSPETPPRTARLAFPAGRPTTFLVLSLGPSLSLGRQTVAPAPTPPATTNPHTPRGVWPFSRSRSPGEAPASTASSGIEPSAGSAPRTSTSLWKPAMLRGAKLTTAITRRPTSSLRIGVRGGQLGRRAPIPARPEVDRQPVRRLARRGKRLGRDDSADAHVDALEIVDRGAAGRLE